jgi:hypothetical protein
LPESQQELELLLKVILQSLFKKKLETNTLPSSQHGSEAEAVARDGEGEDCVVGAVGDDGAVCDGSFNGSDSENRDCFDFGFLETQQQAEAGIDSELKKWYV